MGCELSTSFMVILLAVKVVRSCNERIISLSSFLALLPLNRLSWYAISGSLSSTFLLLASWSNACGFSAVYVVWEVIGSSIARKFSCSCCNLMRTRIAFGTSVPSFS